MNRLAIVSTHPIQYNAPLFRLLAKDDLIDLKVFYSKLSDEIKFDQDFGQEVVWDIPLLDGYEHASFEASSDKGKRSLIDAIEAFNPKAALVYGWNFPGHWAIMRHFKGRIPVWFRGDSTLLDPLPFWKKTARKLLLRMVYRYVDRAFHVGEANKRYFEWAGLLPDQLTYAPHAVDNDFFMREDEARQKLALQKRAELGIPADAKVFLFVGKLESKKQPDILAATFMDAELNNTHLVFIGSGSLEAELKAQCRAKANVHFVGFQNQQSMPVWYSVGDVLCLPSKGPGETWGLVVNEAMASGCAAIVSDRTGCHEDILTSDSVGIRFPADRADDLSASLRYASEHTWDRKAIQLHIGHWSFPEIIKAIRLELNRVKS